MASSPSRRTRSAAPTRCASEIKEQHYADWADRPLPALGGRTARRAVRTKDGRDQVDALLKGIEHREARLPTAERFDVSVLRRALGL